MFVKFRFAMLCLTVKHFIISVLLVACTEIYAWLILFQNVQLISFRVMVRVAKDCKGASALELCLSFTNPSIVVPDVAAARTKSANRKRGQKRRSEKRSWKRRPRSLKRRRSRSRRKPMLPRLKRRVTAMSSAMPWRKSENGTMRNGRGTHLSGREWWNGIAMRWRRTGSAMMTGTVAVMTRILAAWAVTVMGNVPVPVGRIIAGVLRTHHCILRTEVSLCLYILWLGKKKFLWTKFDESQMESHFLTLMDWN